MGNDIRLGTPRPHAVSVPGDIVSEGSARAVRLVPPVDAPVVLETIPHPGDRGVDVQEVGR